LMRQCVGEAAEPDQVDQFVAAAGRSFGAAAPDHIERQFNAYQAAALAPRAARTG